MKNVATLAAFAAGANALVGRSDSCCFHLTASGDASGTIGQLGDGQNRIGGGLPATQFCIDSNGGITDSSGRGCVVTSDTTQFQCDLGKSPMSGFSITSSGELEYNGDADFVACQTGDNNELNLYTTENSSVTGCENINAPGVPGAGASTGWVPGGPASSASVPYGPGPQSSGAVQVTTVYVTETYCGAETTPVVSVPGESTVPLVPVGPGSSAPAGSQPAPSGSPAPQPSETPSYPQSSESPAPQPSETPSYPQSSETPAPQPSETPAPQPSGSPAPQPSGSPAPQPSSYPQTSGTPAPQPSGTPSYPQTSASPSSAQPSGTATQSSSASCPTDLSGDYEYPHLIVPINSSTPDTAYGTQYFGTVSSTVSTIFNFDIPSSDSGKTCSLIFLFPTKDQLETSDYTFSGDGKIDFSQLESAASESTTYNNAPGVKQDYGDFTVSPGNSYLISTFSCPAGQTVSYEMKEAGSTYLNFFEDYNPSPLGLYITVC
ncbi:Cytidylyltransferase family protein [Aspergillus niger]|uniref:Cytidylyltransferase family protein n=1 Tax=Aspergillus niger TaxID=5061 RepID=A0A505HVN5_ASPNG|nr:Cytidylyltransferase family protein [Aspergillus niger]